MHNYAYKLYEPSIQPSPLYSPYWFWLAVFAIVACIVAGKVLLMRVDRRRFYRTNAAGVQLFPTYANVLKCRTVEGLMKLAATGCFVLGVVAAFWAVVLF